MRIVALLFVVVAATPPASTFPEALTHPKKELLASAGRWRWPQPKAFTDAYAVRTASKRGFALVTARVTAVEDPERRGADGDSTAFPSAEELTKRLKTGTDRQTGEMLFLEEVEGGATSLEPLLPYDDWALSRTWHVVRRDGATLDARSWGGVARLEVTKRLEGAEVPESAVADWTYAATLLTASGPIYVDQENDVPRDRWGAGEPGTTAAVAAAIKKGAKGKKEVRELAVKLSRYDSTWEAVIKYAAEQKDDALQLEAYRRFRPMGRCSMDNRPQEIARDYAELCYRLGDLGCFLQLQVRIMGDRFERVAYSSYGEASHKTEAERLHSTGIDVDRFLSGLLVQLPSDAEPRGGELGPSRLARAFIEAGRADFFRKELPRLAQDGRLDAWNRLRATMAWVSLLYREGGEDGAVHAKVEALSLHPAAKKWWDAVVAKQKADALQREQWERERQKKKEQESP